MNSDHGLETRKSVIDFSLSDSVHAIPHYWILDLSGSFVPRGSCPY